MKSRTNFTTTELTDFESLISFKRQDVDFIHVINYLAASNLPVG